MQVYKYVGVFSLPLSFGLCNNPDALSQIARILKREFQKENADPIRARDAKPQV
jgi:hypothetical protein